MTLQARVLGFLVLLVSAGCVAPPDTLPAPDASAVADAMTLADCRQMHLSFPARAEDFAGQVPPGFTIQLTDALLGTTSLFVMVDRCDAPDGEAAALMWIELPVEPDAELAPPEGMHRFVIQGGASHAAVHGRLAGAGFGLAMEAAEATFGDVGPASTRATFDVPRGTYAFTTARTSSSGAFGAESFHRWAADAEGRTSRILVEAGESRNLGVGGVSFDYAGGDAAPPLAQGIAHEVAGAVVTLVFAAVAAPGSP